MPASPRNKVLHRYDSLGFSLTWHHDVTNTHDSAIITPVDPIYDAAEREDPGPARSPGRACRPPATADLLQRDARRFGGQRATGLRRPTAAGRIIRSHCSGRRC
jgi:hypothetical protein